MKATIIKCITSVLALFISVITFAQQDFQGQAFYQSKTSVNMDNFGGREMSEDRKKQMAERMKSMFEKTYILTFNKTESIYKEEEKLATPGQGGGFRMMMGSFSGGKQYKNVKDQKLLQEQEFFGKQFLVKDELPKLEWQMGSETKQIGKYLCFKATAVKQVEDSVLSSFGRRDNNQNDNAEKDEDDLEAKDEVDEVEMPKEIVITAWYTPQIPISQGPGEYWGLPGLILEVSADRTTILCSKIVMNPSEKDEIKAPTKGKEVTKQEYNKIIKKKMEEMSEMFRGRRGRGGGFMRH
jgi:GLPGLI family protein